MIKMNQCPTVSANFTYERPNHAYGTRQADNLILPFPRINPVKHNYPYQFTKSWNEIPAYLKEIVGLRKFKKELIRYILNSY